MSIKEVWVLVLGFFVLLSAVFCRSSLVLDHRGRLGVLEGSAGEEFEDNEGATFL